jgi:catechol 2,3-dioxygenase
MEQTDELTGRIGHINLYVADLERAVAFYCEVLGMHETQHTPGAAIVFLAYGTSPVDLALQLVPGATPPPPGHSGYDHAGIEFPSRAALACAYQRLLDHGIKLSDAQDHGAMLSLYFADLDGNGLEIYWVCPRERWPYQDGRFRMYSRPYDPAQLLDEADE